LGEYFEDRFVELEPSEIEEDFNVVASDAGRNQISFKNNINLFIIRAAAQDNHDNKSRELFTGIVRPYRQRSYKDFSDRSSEIVELESILDRLDELDLSKRTYVLIDGSLLTHMLVIPTELRMSDYRDRKLDLIDKFYELLQKSRKEENLVVAGISKDSNTDILYTTLTAQLIEEELDKMDLPEESIKRIKEDFRKIKYDPTEVRQMLYEIEDEHGVNLDKVRDLLEYYRDTYSDSALIESLKDEPGLTQPIEVGRVSAKFRSHTDDIEEDIQKYIDNNFGHALEDHDNDEEYRKELQRSLEKLFEYPTITTSYWVPEENAQPIRIDLFSDYWSQGGKLTEFEGTRFLERNDIMKELLELLKTGYGGETMHNIWISQADDSASLTQSQIKRVYSPILSKQLGINLRQYMRRRDKRA
jgi:hypothetical protein